MVWTRPGDVTVVGHRWEYEVKIQDYRPRQQSAWCDELPAGAYEITRRQEKICSGSGEDRSCTDRDRYYYTVDGWKYARSVTTIGEHHSAYWPSDEEINLQPADSDGYGQEREEAWVENYWVLLQDSQGKEHTCLVSPTVWGQADAGSVWRVEFGAVAGTPCCETLALIE